MSQTLVPNLSAQSLTTHLVSQKRCQKEDEEKKDGVNGYQSAVIDNVNAGSCKGSLKGFLASGSDLLSYHSLWRSWEALEKDI